MEETNNKITRPASPHIYISYVQNIKPLITILNERAID